MSSGEERQGFDRVFSYVGSNGPFQVVLLLTVSLQGIILSWHHLGYVFLGAVPNHWCRVAGFENSAWSEEQIRNFTIPQKTNGQWESCEYYDLNYTILSTLSYEEATVELESIGEFVGRRKCDMGWIFDNSTYDTTLVTQFEIVCDRRYLVATIQSSYMGGVFLGSLILGSLSDRVIGRRKSVLISIVLILIGGLCATFAQTYWVLITFRFLVAFGVAGAYQNCFVLMMEYTGPKSRSTMGMVQQLPFAIGYMMMAMYAYFIRDWQTLQFAFSVSGVILLAYFWLLPESARWLAVSGKAEKSLQLLLEVGRQNGKKELTPDPIFDIVCACSEVKPRRTATFSIDAPQPEPPHMCFQFRVKVWAPLKDAIFVYWTLLATPEMRRRTLLIWFLFITVDLVYYGVVFDSATLTQDPYLLVFLGGLSEVPAYTVFVPCLSRWGRRPTIILTFILTAISTLLVAAIPLDHETLRMVVSMFGKLFITTAFAVIYLLGTELYPTSTRTTGLAAAVFMGRVGSILAPYVVDNMKTVYADLPNIIFGVVCLISAVFSLLLPETNDVAMADQLCDVEGFSSQKNPAPVTHPLLHNGSSSTKHINPEPGEQVEMDPIPIS